MREINDIPEVNTMYYTLADGLCTYGPGFGGAAADAGVRAANQGKAVTFCRRRNGYPPEVANTATRGWDRCELPAIVAQLDAADRG